MVDLRNQSWVESRNREEEELGDEDLEERYQLYSKKNKSSKRKSDKLYSLDETTVINGLLDHLEIEDDELQYLVADILNIPHSEAFQLIEDCKYN